MTANEISIPVMQSASLIPAAAAGLPTQAVESSSGSPRRDQSAAPVDSVTILNKIQDAKRESRKEDASREGSKQARTMHNVQFAYNQKGDLRIRFMDSNSKLVYQTPPVYFAMMSELMARPELSVNMKI